MSRTERPFGIELLPAAVVIAAGGLHALFLPAAPYMLDSPEFAASAFGLTLSHPPGHPLFETLASVMALLPAGPLAFRMNLFSLLCSTAALVFVVLTAMRVLTAGFGVGRTEAAAASGLVALPLAASPAWIHQATHSEVYGLEVMLLCLALWLASFHLILPREPDGNAPLTVPDDGFRFAVASIFIFSLSLANHPFISLILLPALVASLAAAAVMNRWKAPGRRLLLVGAALGLGLLVYIYVPVRGYLAPTMIMGRIETVGDVLWTLSAKVYQKSATANELGLMTQKGWESIFMLLKESGLILPFLGLGGLYFSLRRKPILPFGILLCLTALLTTLSRAFMPFDLNNPDVFGYMMIVMVVQAVAAAAFFGAVSRVRFGRALGFVILLAVLPSVAAPNAHKLMAMHEARDCPGKAMSILRTATTGRFQPNAKVFSTFYSTTFMDLFDERVLASRPDLQYTGIAFLGYRGVAAQTAASSEEMKRVIRGYLAAGGLQSSDMAYLALYHPVYIEPYPELGDDFIPYLLPEGAGFQFLPQPVSIKDFKAAAGDSNEALTRLLARMGDCCVETQTGRYLLWLLYNRALVIARRGDVDGAIEASRLGLKLYPGVPQLETLVKVLKKNRKPIVDVKPFLPPRLL